MAHLRQWGTGGSMRFAIRAIAIAVAVTAIAVIGGGVAAGNSDYNGLTYAKASEQIKNNGNHPVIATVFGSELPTDQCIVTNMSKSRTLNASGSLAHSATYMFDLNCNLSVARPGKPGNSVVTPEGRHAKNIQDNADLIDSNVASKLAAGEVPFCGRDEAHFADCKSFCDQYELCSTQVLDYLASVSF
ncbi:hypothetical protein ACTXG7_03880 [Mycolicibacterium sp. Dal123E01]|uniref:hypothetical protein n=1 Tax=Mycolicibacterium sp. Dal123E01 TaxID=3457578 RepID=UPI00403EAD9E